MILSILICTIPKRKNLFDRLHMELRTQILTSNCNVEILADNGEGTIGAKRQRLIEKAQGEYVVMIDDDDWISEDYLRSILEALKSEPDVVGFCGWITTNGLHKKKFTISKDCDYVDTGHSYERFNNHLCPVRKSLAMEAGYEDISWQEDFNYAVRLRPLIKTEVFIPKMLYFYKYVTKKTYT